MAVPAQTTERADEDETFEQTLARLRATPQERAQRIGSMPPFDYEAWLREAGPATPKELAEMEAFLRGRAAERQQSLAQDETPGENGTR